MMSKLLPLIGGTLAVAKSLQDTHTKTKETEKSIEENKLAFERDKYEIEMKKAAIKRRLKKEKEEEEEKKKKGSQNGTK